jgi:selenocysteine-specific elongation factor
LNRGALVTTEPDFYTLAKRVYLIIRPVYNGEELKLKRRGEVEISGGTWHDWATVKVIGPLPASIAIAEATLSSERPWHFGQTVVLIRSGSSRPLAQATVLTAAALTPEQFGRLSDLVHTHNALPAEIADEEYLKLFLDGWGLITTTQKKSLSLLGEQYNRFGSWYLEVRRLEALKAHLMDRVAERGLYPLETYKTESPYPHRLTHLVVESMIAQEVVSLAGGNLQTTDTQGTTMGAEEEQLLKTVEASGFSGHLVKHITKTEKRLLGQLLQKKLIIIVDSTYIYSTAVFEEIIERIIDGRAVGSTFSIAEAKDGLPLSRKYMLPLLNKMEELGFVERDGDMRRVVRAAGKL